MLVEQAGELAKAVERIGSEKKWVLVCEIKLKISHIGDLLL